MKIFVLLRSLSQKKNKFMTIYLKEKVKNLINFVDCKLKKSLINLFFLLNYVLGKLKKSIKWIKRLNLILNIIEFLSSEEFIILLTNPLGFIIIYITKLALSYLDQIIKKYIKINKTNSDNNEE